jgi:hypothetical protein
MGGACSRVCAVLVLEVGAEVRRSALVREHEGGEDKSRRCSRVVQGMPKRTGREEEGGTKGQSDQRTAERVGEQPPRHLLEACNLPGCPRKRASARLGHLLSDGASTRQCTHTTHRTGKQ